jgi:hypothetical protein
MEYLSLRPVTTWQNPWLVQGAALLPQPVYLGVAMVLSHRLRVVQRAALTLLLAFVDQ